MPVNREAYKTITEKLNKHSVKLIAVSKTKPVEDIRELYALGQRDFGENYVQELLEKAPQLPNDIRWHFIGHLQSNKVKSIIPFVYLIHGVDSLKLLKEIGKQAIKNESAVKVLLQVHIANEETKFGMDEAELRACWASVQQNPLPEVTVAGLMGMASLTDDTQQIRSEFATLKQLAQSLEGLQSPELSMGMSSDYGIAIEEGSTMVRIGSLLFGARQYT